MTLTLLYFNDFAKPAFQLITASSSIELIDQNSVSVTHRAVNLVLVISFYVIKFTHLRVDWISLLLTCNLSCKFRFSVVMVLFLFIFKLTGVGQRLNHLSDTRVPGATTIYNGLTIRHWMKSGKLLRNGIKTTWTPTVYQQNFSSVPST